MQTTIEQETFEEVVDCYYNYLASLTDEELIEHYIEKMGFHPINDNDGIRKHDIDHWRWRLLDNFDSDYFQFLQAYGLI